MNSSMVIIFQPLNFHITLLTVEFVRCHIIHTGFKVAGLDTNPNEGFFQLVEKFESNSFSSMLNRNVYRAHVTTSRLIVMMN